MMAQAAKAKTAEHFNAQGFGVKAMLASAARLVTNPQRPPYFDLPIADGKPVPDVIATWGADAPLARLETKVLPFFSEHLAFK